jgi:hypothetical protein
MGAFTPLDLPRLGVAPQDVAGWTGAIVFQPCRPALPALLGRAGRPLRPPAGARARVGSVGLIWDSRRLRFLFPALFVLFAGWMLANTYVPCR